MNTQLLATTYESLNSSNRTSPTTPMTNMTNTDETTIVNETPISQSNSTTLAPPRARLDNLNDNITRPREVVAIQPFQPVPLRIDNSSDASNVSSKTDFTSQSSLPIGSDQNQDRAASRSPNNNDTLSEPAPRAR